MEASNADVNSHIAAPTSKSLSFLFHILPADEQAGTELMPRPHLPATDGAWGWFQSEFMLKLAAISSCLIALL